MMLTSFLGASSSADKEDELNTTQSSEDEINPTLGGLDSLEYNPSAFKVFIKALGCVALTVFFTALTPLFSYPVLNPISLACYIASLAKALAIYSIYEYRIEWTSKWLSVTLSYILIEAIKLLIENSIGYHPINLHFEAMLPIFLYNVPTILALLDLYLGGLVLDYYFGDNNKKQDLDEEK